MNKTSSALSWKGMLKLSASVLVVAPGWVAAQDNQDADEEDQQQQLEEIVVTGTATGTGIRGVAPVGSQTLEIPRIELVNSPVRDAAEIISYLPQGSQIGSGVADADGGNDAGESGLNLRGLGGNASLQLLDGHRMASQGVSSIGADPSSIPFAAIERVEVVLDGASSIYGSDAVAGVVNYIMRDSFDGVDIQYSGLQGGYDSHKIDLLAGNSWGNFSVMVGASYEDQEEFLQSERAYLRQDLRPFGGSDYRHRRPTAGNEPIISVGRQDYYVPEDFVGQTVTDPNDPSRTFLIPTVAELIPITADNADQYLADEADYSTYMSALERESLFARMTYEPVDTVQLQYTALWSKREAHGTSWGRVPISIDANSPYFIPGLVAPDEDYGIMISQNDNGAPNTADPYVSTVNHYLDLRLDIGAWQMNTSVFYGRTNGADINRPERNNAALTHDPAGTPDGYLNYAWYENDPEWFNPYLTDERQPQPDFEKLHGWTWRFADQHLSGFNTRFEGPIFDLPGGEMRLNVGLEFTDADHWLGLPQTVRYYPDPEKRIYWLRDTNIDRRVSSAFAEIYAPLVQGRPGIQRLALSLSARVDDYSDFGRTTNPRFGLTWDVNDSLTVRASAGEAFRAPTLTQMNPGVNSTLTQTTITNNGGIPIPVTDPANNESRIFSRGGRTPSLGPETAEMWSIGVDITPVAVEGLRVALTYYDVDYSDRIESLPNWETAFSSPQNYNIYAPYIYPINQPASCVAGNLATYDPALTAWLDLEGTRFAGNQDDCEVVAVIDRGEQNVGSVFQTGLDFQASYDWDTSIGAWRASVNVAEILNLDRALISGAEVFSVLDRIGWQISRRSNVRLTWSNADWTASLTAKIEGSYLNDDHPDGPDAYHQVSSWATYDLMVGYRAPQTSGPLSGVTVALGAQNLTNEDPPIILHGRSAFDSNFHNPFGRMWRVELGKRFE